VRIKSTVVAIVLTICVIDASANTFLRVNPFARAAGMGDAYTALSDGSYGMYYNPAGMLSILGYEAQYTRGFWWGGIGYDYLTLVNPDPILSWGKIGLGFLWVRAEESALNDEIIDWDCPECGGSSYSLYGFQFGSAFDIVENVLSVGLKLDFTTEYMEDYVDFKAYCDIGFIYRTIFSGNLLRVGLVLTGLGSDSVYVSEGFDFPVNVRLGISDEFVLEDSKLVLSGEIFSEFRTGRHNFFIGAEYLVNDFISFRAGYKTAGYTHPSLGVGIRKENIELHYAYNSLDGYGATHTLSLVYSWGTPPARIDVYPDKFSPNGDSVLDNVMISPVLGEKDLVTALRVNIYDEKGEKKIYSFSVDDIDVKTVTWDGKVKGRVLKDGKYRVSVEADYIVNGSSESYKYPVEIDNTPPRIKVDASPEHLIKSGSKALLIPATFTFYAEDKNTMAMWKLEITDSNNRLFFRTGEQIEPPFTYIWDGASNNGEYVKSGNIYYYSFSVKDEVGNTARTKPKAQVVLLREIKLTFSADTLFDDGKADVKLSAYSKLKGMKDVIKKHPESVIIVAGHTDDRENPGTFKTRQALSKARAEAVKFYMLNLLKIKDKKIETTGHGASLHVASNRSKEERAKNRRVEVIIRSTIYK